MQRLLLRMRIQRYFDRKFFSSLPPLTPQQLPSPMETHLWYMIPDEVKGENLLNQYLEILPPCEKEHVFRMRGKELRKKALLARVLVRTTIARYQINSLPVTSPRLLKFRKNAHGKPEVDWQQNDECHPPPLHFNMSHTASLIACGVTTGGPIGIDVEEKQRVTKHSILSLAHRYFSEREVEFLTSLENPVVQHREFIKLWTLKEAYVKALGKGFSGAPFKTFTIMFRHFSERSFHMPGDSSFEVPDIILHSAAATINPNTNWRFLLLELTSSHYAAVCTGNDCPAGGGRSKSIKLSVWRTIPFCEDEYVSGTDVVLYV